MYHYNIQTALEELNEEAVLPNPVHVRDMILRAHRALHRSQPDIPRVSEALWRSPEAGARAAEEPGCEVTGS